METKETNQGGYIGSAKIAEPKSKKGLGMTLTEAIGELEKGYRICNQDEPKGFYYNQPFYGSSLVFSYQNGRQIRRLLATFKKGAENNKSVWYIYQSDKLKHPTQQERVELIETQNLVSFAKSKEIADLTKRNGNLTRIVNDQTERIEVMQNELKNYESATKVIETKYNSLCTSMDNLEIAHEKEISNIKESRERLASKFTNWFIFLVFIVCVELAVIVAMILRAVNYNLPIF